MDIVQLLKPAIEILDQRAREAFRSGQEILARVVGLDKDGQIRLRLPGGQTVTASSEARVKVGDTVRVVIEQPPDRQAPAGPARHQPAQPSSVPQGPRPTQTSGSPPPLPTAKPGSPPVAPQPKPADAPSQSGRPGAEGTPQTPAPRPDTYGQPVRPASVPSDAGEAPRSANARPGIPAPAPQSTDTTSTRSATAPPPATAEPQAPPEQAHASNELMETLKGMLVVARRTASREFGTLATTVARLLSQAGTGSSPRPESARQEVLLIARTLQAYEQLGKGDVLSEEAVRRLVEDSGVFLESRLAAGRDVSSDMKAALLKLRGHLQALQQQGAEGGDKTAPRTQETTTLAARLMGHVGEELSDIEARQAANLISRSDSPAFHATIPLTGDFRRSELTVMRDGAGNENSSSGAPRHYRVVLQLEMTQLGSIRVDAVQSGKEISLAFIAKNRETLETLESGFDTLRERFTELDIPVREIFARTGTEPPLAAPGHQESRLFSRKA